MDNLIRSNPGAGLYQTHFSFIDGEGKEIRKCKGMPHAMTSPEFVTSLLLNNIDIMGTGFMMRASDYDRIGGLPDYPNLLFADFEMVVRLVLDKYFAIASEECFSFRIHQSTTTTSADIKMQLGFERLIYFLNGLKNSDPSLEKVITENGNSFINAYCKGLSHRLIRTPLTKRNNLTVGHFLEQCKRYAFILTGKPFDPGSDLSIRVAKWIDSNALTRKMFLLFKQVYSKPIIK
jgi:hypothetical protein